MLWIVRAGNRAAIDLHAHGLHQLRLDPRRLILVAAKGDDEALWAMEEGLKAKSLGAVLGEIEKLDLTASRRLQLAAEAGGVTAFVLRRWRVMERATARRRPADRGGHPLARHRHAGGERSLLARRTHAFAVAESRAPG